MVLNVNVLLNTNILGAPTPVWNKRGLGLQAQPLLRWWRVTLKGLGSGRCLGALPKFLAEWQPQQCPQAGWGGFAALSSFLVHQLLLMRANGHLPCCCLPQGLPGGIRHFHTFLSLPEKCGWQGGQNSC